MMHKGFKEDNCEIMQTLVGLPFTCPSTAKLIKKTKLSTITTQCPFFGLCERDDKGDYRVCKKPIKKAVYMNIIRVRHDGKKILKYIRSEEGLNGME